MGTTMTKKMDQYKMPLYKRENKVYFKESNNSK